MKDKKQKEGEKKERQKKRKKERKKKRKISRSKFFSFNKESPQYYRPFTHINSPMGFAISKRWSNGPIPRARSTTMVSRIFSHRSGNTSCPPSPCNNSSRVFEGCRDARNFSRIPRRSRSSPPSSAPPLPLIRSCWQRTRTEFGAPRTRSPASRTNRSDPLVFLRRTNASC